MNIRKAFPIFIVVALTSTGILYQNCGHVGDISQEAQILSSTNPTAVDYATDSQERLYVTLQDGTQVTMVKHKQQELVPLVVTLKDGTVIRLTAR
ncbi:MAG: hypothetical protein KDD46_07945 [Bdellovibrionales bacterium]|nr:hypothetical protein [Bdellovibrionales bacterium]